jgi:hypothetical protein
MAFLLDADVFIRAKNQHYGFDFCPAFWEWLVMQNRADGVFSVEKVEDELKAQDDELTAWAVERGTDFFLRPSQNTLPALARVSEWVAEQSYTPTAINVFLQAADYYLIGEALARGDVVVTHEIGATTVNKVKIPNVCIGLGIKYVTPFEMLRQSRARFDLRST